MTFQNPTNGYQETIDKPGLWCLLFGCFYFASKGVWTHAILGFVLALSTGTVSWFVYPFFARQILEKHYLRNGWIPVGGTPPAGAAFANRNSSAPPRTAVQPPSAAASLFAVVVGGIWILLTLVTVAVLTTYLLQQHKAFASPDLAAFLPLIVTFALLLWSAFVVVRRGLRRQGIGTLGWALAGLLLVAIASGAQKEFARSAITSTHSARLSADHKATTNSVRRQH